MPNLFFFVTLVKTIRVIIMKKILFPTDFSETADNAFIYALHFAKSVNADLYVLHTYDMPVISSTSAGQPDLIQEVYNTIEFGHFDAYKEKVPQMREIAEQHQLGDVNMTFIFEEGSLLYTIQRIIKDENIELVVMGTNGKSGWDKKILGSNTSNVIRNVDIPILSVPFKAKFKRLERFGFATLLKPSDRKGLRQIFNFTKGLNAEVKCLHILRKENPEVEMLVKEWQNFFIDDKLEITTVLNRDLEQSVYYFIDEHLIDVMCIVKRQMGFFERLFSSSLSQKLSYHADVPVLVLQEGENIDD